MKTYKFTENNIIYDIEEYSNGSKFWHLNGKHHREYGPAIETFDGDKYWMLNGKHHREYGHAIETFDGDKLWYINDVLHRDDGPAIERHSGIKEYWHNGIHLEHIKTDKELKRYIKLLSIY